MTKAPILTGDGERIAWPYSNARVTSATAATLRALLLKGPDGTVERCIAAASLKPSQRRVLFAGASTYTVRMLAYSGRRLVALDLVGFCQKNAVRINYYELARAVGKAGQNRRRLIELLLPFAKD